MRQPMDMRLNLPLRFILAAALLAASAGLSAETKSCGSERNVRAAALEEMTWRQLNAIYQDVGESQYDKAFSDLRKMLARSGSDTYLQAILNQALAQVEWARENYASALQYFERVLELDALPDQTHFLLMYQVAQLYFMQERFDEALERLNLWFCKAPGEKITPAAFVLMASIQVQRGELAEALQAIETAIDMDADPKEQWFRLKLAVQYELERYPQAAETLEEIISRWPDERAYWMQLSRIYYNLKLQDRALAVAALAYRKNLLDREADITYLSGLYGHSGLPFKAAEVLERGIRDGTVEPGRKNWTLIAQSWYAAEELDRSLAAYEEAGRTAIAGDIDLRRAYILVDLERWTEALQALDRALGKGGLDQRRTGEAYLLRGMTRFNLGDFDQAADDWENAGHHEKTRDSARQWLNHLAEERQRAAS